MHVALVARCLNAAHVRGMGRYVGELLRQSTLAGGDLEWHLLADDPSRPLRAPAGLRGRSDVFRFRGDRFDLWEQLGSPLHARRAGVDLLHCTEGALPWWQPVPTVVTLHDTVAWEEHDGSAGSRFYFNRLVPAALARCAAVITISECSKRDILAKWPALADKLSVIPHGIADEYLVAGPALEASSLQRSLGELPYLVYLGGPAPRKRFDWAVRVLQDTGRNDLQLVACGFGDTAREAAAARLPVDLRGRVRFAPFLSDAELLSLYRGAACVLYPTRYEGFGFPAIEAQAAGTPVVFSAVSSLAELVGPLSFVVEPDDLSGWCRAVVQAQRLGHARSVRALEARQWAARYSWKRSFELHRDVYGGVARNRADRR